VKKHRGTISGEHGDGRLRGEFIPLLYGEETYELMRQVKQCWDSNGLFNRHKVIDTFPMDSMLRFDENQSYAIEKIIGTSRTYYNWKAAFDECDAPGATGAKSQTHALMCSIEQCNGAGDCRKSNIIGGTMCPAFKVSGDELNSTRARANVLREILTRGELSIINYQLSIIKEVLDSCLACKGCRGECPSNVDITRIRAELLQHYYDRHGTPLRTFLVARLAQIEQLGRTVRPLYNFAARWKPSANIIKRIVKFAPERSIPQLGKKTMRQLVAEQQQVQEGKPKKRVFLYADEFTSQHEAEIGLAFARLLQRLGYQVTIPDLKESGRAAISKGCLKRAKAIAKENIQRIIPFVNDDCPLVGIEPSAILTFRDEYPDLVPAEHRADAIQLAKNCLLYDEFIKREMDNGNICAEDFKSDEMEIWLHGHCHQKALVGIEKTVEILKLLRGAKLHVIPSGCCGMAGSFGYEKEHYKTSLAIGEMILFPTIRKIINYQSSIVNSNVPTFVAAPGTSCRQQILDGTGVYAVHPIELLTKYLI
jgi:Fe-S oxidoreductase